MLHCSLMSLMVILFYLNWSEEVEGGNFCWSWAYEEMQNWSLLPLNAVFWLLLNEINPLQNVSDIINPSLLPYGKGISSLWREEQWVSATCTLRANNTHCKPFPQNMPNSNYVILKGDGSALQELGARSICFKWRARVASCGLKTCREGSNWPRPTLARQESSRELPRLPSQHLHHTLPPAHRSLQCPFYKVRNSREGRWQHPAMEQASEANCMLSSSSPLLTLSGSICVGIRKDLGVISQTGWRRAAWL